MYYGRIIATAVLLLATAPALPAENNPLTADYEIHEWGVLAGCNNHTNYFNTSRPLKVYAIREPVIYVHSRDKQPFSLDVTFLAGTPTDTYPPASVKNNVVSWHQVTFPNREALSVRSIPRDRFVPLKDIMNALSDVDSDTLLYEGQTSKFLFYEGEVAFTNRVLAMVDPLGSTVVISNAGPFAVYDVLLTHPGEQTGPLPFHRQSLIATIARLDATQSATIMLTARTNQVSFIPQLEALGFTEAEARSFNTLWQHPMTQIGNLTYRLSDEECNQLTSLAFDPMPRRCIRALYVVVKP